MGKRTWTDEQLIEATKNSTSLKAVAKYLNLSYGGYQSTTLKERIRTLNLDIAHMDKVGRSVFGTDQPEKFCTYHKEYEPIENFGKVKKGRGISSACKLGNSARSGAVQRLNKYGIDDFKLNFLLTEQDFKCANVGCRRPQGKKILAIDHDHTCCAGKYSCGKCIRGLLCGQCNAALGYLADNKDRLYGLIDYLDKWSSLEEGVA